MIWQMKISKQAIYDIFSKLLKSSSHSLFLCEEHGNFICQLCFITETSTVSEFSGWLTFGIK